MGTLHAVESPRKRMRVLAVASNKGGVGKTTIALNLAVYLRALREELPILVIGLDDQSTIDRMFALEPGTPPLDLKTALRRKHLAPAIRLGQYGVSYVPTSRDIGDLKRSIDDVAYLDAALRTSGFEGLVVIDTKSDLEILTQNAIFTSDLSVVVVKDMVSLQEAQRVFELLTAWGRPAEQARVLLSLVDLRIKFDQPGTPDVLALLVSRIRDLGLPLFESFLSRSPKVESLYTNPDSEASTILHGAHGSLVHQQMAQLADEVLKHLAAAVPAREPASCEATPPPASDPAPLDPVLMPSLEPLLPRPPEPRPKRRFVSLRARLGF